MLERTAVPIKMGTEVIIDLCEIEMAPSNVTVDNASRQPPPPHFEGCVFDSSTFSSKGWRAMVESVGCHLPCGVHRVRALDPDHALHLTTFPLLGAPQSSHNYHQY